MIVLHTKVVDRSTPTIPSHPQNPLVIPCAVFGATLIKAQEVFTWRIILVSKWLITMAIISPQDLGQRGTPSKWPNFMAYKWGVHPNHLQSSKSYPRSAQGMT